MSIVVDQAAGRQRRKHEHSVLREQRVELFLHLGAHAQLFERVELDFLGGELHQGPFAGLRALAGDLAVDFLFADFGGQAAFLPRAAIVDFQARRVL